MGFHGRNVEAIGALIDLDAEEGIYVIHVCEGGPADRAGVRDDYLAVQFTARLSGRGDIITGVDGRPVKFMQDLIAYVNTLDVGDAITLELLRYGSSSKATLTLGEWEDDCL